MLSIPKYPEQYAQHFPTIFYLLCCASQHHVMERRHAPPPRSCLYAAPARTQVPPHALPPPIAPGHLPCPVTPPCLCPLPPPPPSQAGSARAARLQGPASVAGRVSTGLRRRGGTETGKEGVCVGEGGVRVRSPTLDGQRRGQNISPTPSHTPPMRPTVPPMRCHSQTLPATSPAQCTPRPFYSPCPSHRLAAPVRRASRAPHRRPAAWAADGRECRVRGWVSEV